MLWWRLIFPFVAMFVGDPILSRPYILSSAFYDASGHFWSHDNFLLSPIKTQVWILSLLDFLPSVLFSLDLRADEQHCSEISLKQREQNVWCLNQISTFHSLK